MGKKLFLVALAAAVIFAAASFLINNQDPATIEIRGNVTIFAPKTIGLDPDSCDASMLSVRISTSGEYSEKVNLGVGEALHGDDGDACLYGFTVEAPVASAYTLSATGSGLPPRTIDRVAERLFRDEDGEYLLWEIWWET